MNGADDDDSLSISTCFTLGGPAATLVVRAWLEPGPENQPVIRGTIANLGGKMLGAFNSLEQLAALVDAHLVDASETPPPE